MTPTPETSSVPHKYAPTPDPRWTPDIEAEFLARLDRLRTHEPPESSASSTPGPAKALLLTAYAIDTLKAQRLSCFYLTTLNAVIGRIASAEHEQSECTVSQRDAALGSRQTLRTLQAQLEAAGVLQRDTRQQGHGHSGTVFVYRPSSRYVPSGFPSEELEAVYRAVEGETDYPSSCAGIDPEDFTH